MIDFGKGKAAVFRPASDLPDRGPVMQPGRPASEALSLFLLHGADACELRAQVYYLAQMAPSLSRRGLTELAGQLAAWPGRGPWRAAIVADSPQALSEGLTELLIWLGEGREWGTDVVTGVWLARAAKAPRVAFVFPGQNAPVSFDGGGWTRRFPELRALFADPSLPAPGDPSRTAIIQPYIAAAHLAGLAVLERFGVQADLALGHSFGELAALHWGGAFDAAGLLRLAAERGRLMERCRSGAMCHIAAPISELYWLMEPSPKVVVSCINGPDSTVLSGPVAAVEVVADRARRRGWTVTRLAVNRAFHSTAMSPAARGLADWMAEHPARLLQRRVVSSVTGATLYPRHNLRCHLMEHMTSPVRFIEAMDHLATAADVCVEVGPGSQLSSFTKSWLDLPILSLDVGGDDLRGLLGTLGALYARGVAIDRDALLPARGLSAYRGSNGFNSAILLARRPVTSGGCGARWRG